MKYAETDGKDIMDNTLLPEDVSWEEYFEHSLLHDPLPEHPERLVHTD